MLISKFLQLSLAILALSWAFSLTVHAVLAYQNNNPANFPPIEALCTTDSECAEFFPNTNGEYNEN